MNLTWQVIEGAAKTLDRWRSKVAQWADSPSAPLPAEYREDFLAALDADLDTPRALSVLRTLEKDPQIPDGSKFEFFAWADRFLGLDLARTVGQVPAPTEISADLQSLLDERAAARAAKDFATSDRIRDELATRGYTVTDTPEGQVLT
jgi:Cysteinyl-tRNA synthetase